MATLCNPKIDAVFSAVTISTARWLIFQTLRQSFFVKRHEFIFDLPASKLPFSKERILTIIVATSHSIIIGANSSYAIRYADRF